MPGRSGAARTATSHPDRDRLLALRGGLIFHSRSLSAHLLQVRISQKPLERGVFTLERFEPLDPSPRPGWVTQLSTWPSSGRPNRSITAGGRFVELRVNSRYRGVNTRRPGVNS